MEFVNPGFLYGLFALSVPVIIHLFNFRQFKKVYFSNVAFIRELKLETQKQSRLKHLIILILRMLAFACIVLAFAQPFIPAGTAMIHPESHNLVSVYIDNSFSMQAESEEGTMLESAKVRAAEIAAVYKSSDRFQLLTNDFEGWRMRFFNREEFLEHVEKVRITPATRMVTDIISRQEDLLKQEPIENKTAYLISDFQKSFFPDKIMQPDTLVNFYFIHLQAFNSGNLFIDSCWFDTPVQHLNQQSQLNVSFQNSSATPYERIPVKLHINGMQKALASIDIEPDETKQVTLSFTNSETGIQFGKVEIPDYPITFDDAIYFSYTVKEIISVLSINGNAENEYLGSLFKNDTGFIFRNVPVKLLDYSTLPNYSLIILNELQTVPSGLRQEIIRFIESGGSVVVVPPENADLESYNHFLGEIGDSRYGAPEENPLKISAINLKHPIYADVFEEVPENINLPEVFIHFPIIVPARQLQDKLLELENGRIFLNVQPFGRGQVYLFAVNFQPPFSNFPRHPIFVPTLYKIAISSVTGQRLYHTIGENENIILNKVNLPGDKVVKVKAAGEEFEFIPRQRKMNSDLELDMFGQIQTAGFYYIINEQEPVHGLAFNYNRKESEMNFFSTEDLKTYLSGQGLLNFRVLETEKQPFVKTIRDMSQGKQLWRLFVMGALMFLLGEVLLLRFWR
jgi:hypothetical protein